MASQEQKLTNISIASGRESESKRVATIVEGSGISTEVGASASNNLRKGKFAVRISLNDEHLAAAGSSEALADIARDLILESLLLCLETQAEFSKSDSNQLGLFDEDEDTEF